MNVLLKFRIAQRIIKEASAKNLHIGVDVFQRGLKTTETLFTYFFNDLLNTNDVDKLIEFLSNLKSDIVFEKVDLIKVNPELLKTDSKSF